jgi:DNA adenine methylase
VKPFLKWPGGKRWSAQLITKIVKAHLVGSYYEPFVGGGAVFFELLPKRAILSDINDELIETYKQIKTSHLRIRSLIQAFPVNKEFYEELRATMPTEVLMRAARLLYLNRTAFGGIYRLNQSGQFNVPFGGGGRTPALLWQTDILSNAARALKSATLKQSDFEKVMEGASKGDVIYCDPTYTVAHDNNGFRRYNESVFSWNDQERLAIAAAKAQKKGITVLVSNAHHQSVYDLFVGSSRCEAHTLVRTSCMATSPRHRKQVQEYLFEFSANSSRK